ncbi:MAG: hypothetical protein PUF72_06680 [Clostridiales bacterium]|nr:hypothetical protein [Clostridiales bacterium]
MEDKKMDNEKTKVTSALCTNCGGQLDIDTSQETVECPYCATKYNVSDLLDESDAVRIEKIKQRTQKDVEIEKLRHEKEMAQKHEDKANKEAFKKSKFSKVLIVFAIICGLMCAVSFNDKKILSGIIALIQVGLFAAAWLMGMHKVKEPKKGIKSLASILAFLLFIPYFGAFNSSSSNTQKINWNDMVLCEKLPEPASKVGTISSNSEERLSVDMHKTSQKDYSEYVSQCEALGFTTDADKTETNYSAYNADGYKLHLSYYERNKELSIDLDAPMKLSEITWPNTPLTNQIPVPNSTLGKVNYEHADSYSVYIGNMQKSDYDAYVQSCMDKGFNIDYSKNENSFHADNSSGSHLSLEYRGNNIMYISIEAPDNSAAAQTTEAPKDTPQPASDTKDTKPASTTADSGVSPDFKAAMDSYEQFFDEYIAFMKKYESSDGTDLSLLADYTKYMAKYADTMQKLENIESDDLNAAELAYYTEVHARIIGKLAEVGQ